MVTAMVLAAGLGTRLRPLTHELPKPLLPLGDRPVLQHVLDRLARAGVERVIVNAHHLSAKILEFANGYGLIVHVEEELEIRGTAGGLAGVRQRLGSGPVLVTNADLVLDPPVHALLAQVERGGMCLAVTARPAGEGRVGLGAQGQIVRLRDERFGEEQRGADYLGVAGVGGDVLGALPERGCLIGDVALPLLRRGASLGSVEESGTFFSVGDSVADYVGAQRLWLAQEGLESFVAPTARVERGIELESCVIGAGAAVAGTGRLRECVIWPGARARAPLEGAVVTAAGVTVHRDGRVERAGEGAA